MKKNCLILLICGAFLFPHIASSQTNQSPVIAGNNIAIVQTESGTVKGYIHKNIYTYKGIPYAYAQRFTAPAKPKPWQGIRSSMAYGPVCPIDATTSENDVFEFPYQHNLGFTNENCQNLNIWTQKVNDGKKRPVMVWFHGGGYTNGSAIEQPGYDGENLARKGDVVVVTVNHRLNILGFLDLSAYGEKYKGSANAGLMDLVAALQWVKQNIAQFGGDPNNVTIFGQSGGGGKVSCMMNAPSAKGLFHKAIVESGTAATSFPEKSASQRIAAALLEELHLQPSQVDSLQTISYERLNTAGKVAVRKASAALRAEGKRGGGGWGPNFDGYFFPYQPGEQSAKDLAKNIPLIVGTTKNEFTPFTPDPEGLTMEQVRSTLQKQYGDKADAYIAAVKKAYPNTTNPADYIDIDTRFRPGAVRQATLKAVPGAAPVYVYLFAWQSPVNDGIYKAMHCMEIPFVFNNISRCEEMTGGGKDAYALADKLSNAWINFARTGDPNGAGVPKWPVYLPDVGATMIFDNQCIIGNHHDEELQKIAASNTRQ